MARLDQGHPGAHAERDIRQLHQVLRREQVDHRPVAANLAQSGEAVWLETKQQLLCTGRKDIHPGQSAAQNGTPVDVAGSPARIGHGHVQ